MEPLSIQEIANAIGAARSGPDFSVTSITTDSRDIADGSLFVALSGERFDGHDYVARALEQGAVLAVVNEARDFPAEKILLVKDTRQALLDIAGLYRRQRDCKVVAVTGSVGKTTTKEMIACVVESSYPTLKTEANLNNEIGLSQMLLRLEDSHRAAVLEMGMDGPGQIAPMSRAARPDIGVVTNTGVSHLEALGSRENIMREKLDIAAGIPDGGILLLNGDDALLQTHRDKRLEVLFYSIDNPHAHIRAENIRVGSEVTDFDILYNGDRYHAVLPAIGTHNVGNALAAFGVGVKLGIPSEQAAKALSGYETTGMRQHIVKLGGITLVEDCYNASPDSMLAALRTLGGMGGAGRKIAVLSDMLELGPVEIESHMEVGRAVAKSGIDILLATGERAKAYVEAAHSAGMVESVHYPDKQALADALLELLRPGDTVWLKASRGMKLEEVAQRIRDQYQSETP